MTVPKELDSPAQMIVRPPLDHELDAFASCVESAFSMHFANDERDRFIEGIDCERSLAGFVGDELVATLSSHVVDLTIPGPAQHPAVVITEAAVQPAYRRRGALSSLLSRHLCDMHDEGQAIAVLSASRGSIYGRFGFGAATFGASYEIDQRADRLEPPLADELTGRVRVLSAHEAKEVLPVVFSVERLRRPGEIERPLEWWDEITDADGQDGTPRFFVSYDQGDEVTGYLIYDVVPRGREVRDLVVVEACYLTTDARRGLWTYLLDVDLISAITTGPLALDETLPLLFRDPRAVSSRRIIDRTWFRLIDASVALSQRRYNGSGRVVIALFDQRCPWNEGSFEISVHDGEATVSRTDDEVDLELGASELAMIYLGATRPSSLVQAHRIRERTEGAADLADRLFAAACSPYCTALG